MLADFLIVGLFIGWLRGGRLENLSHLRFSCIWLILLGMVAKFIFLLLPLPHASLFHLLSMLVVFVGTLFNLKLSGMPFLALGSLANVIVMAANWGKMPVSVEVARWLKLDNLVRNLEQGLYPDYIPVSGSSHLSFLADILPYFSLLFRKFFVVSIGDYLLGLGVLWFLIHYLGRKGKKICETELPRQSSR
ncbi:MAG: DUF5317 domain-containing protein [Atribacterota bacterium]|nr:DUF5317 domain-containing protein [Atribacterota bacterium]